MPNFFPNLGSGWIALYPLVETVSCSTGIIKYLNDAEQLWPRRPPLRAFTLSLQKCTAADRQRVEDFILSTKGPFDSSWSIQIGGTTWNNMAFAGDDFPWQAAAQSPGYFDIALKIEQRMP